MDLGIRGRWALVCASSKGLGLGCARALAADGVNLVMNARGADALAQAAADIRARCGVEVVEVACDVTTPEGRQIRSEFVTVGRTGHRAMADVLDACALAVATGSIHVAPGAVIPNAVGLVDPGRTCEHLVLTPPFLWPDLQVVDETGGPDGTGPLLTRLQAVPITTAEMSAIGRDGADDLFEQLDTADADVTNPDRPSVV